MNPSEDDKKEHCMKVKLRNRLEVLMKDNGVSTFEEMAERMTNNQNWEITRSALSRKFRNPNPPLTLEIIEAICNELQCLPNDLFEIEISDASEEDISDLQDRVLPFRYGQVKKLPSKEVEHETKIVVSPQQKRKHKVDSSVLEDVLGPNVSHLHKGKIDNG